MAIAEAVELYQRARVCFGRCAGYIKQHDGLESEELIPLALSWSLIASVSWGWYKEAVSPETVRKGPRHTF